LLLGLDFPVSFPQGLFTSQSDLPRAGPVLKHAGNMFLTLPMIQISGKNEIDFSRLSITRGRQFQIYLSPHTLFFFRFSSGRDTRFPSVTSSDPLQVIAGVCCIAAGVLFQPTGNPLPRRSCFTGFFLSQNRRRFRSPLF